MEPTSPLPFFVSLDESDDPCDLIDALALDGFVSGSEPWARTLRLDRVRPDAALRPADTEPARVAHDSGRSTQLVRGPGWTLRSTRWRGDVAAVTVTAATDDLARRILADATDNAVEPEPPEDDALV